MEIIHLLFTRNTKAKMSPLVDIIHQLATEQVKIGYDVTVWHIGSKPLDLFNNKAYKTKNFSTNLFVWNTAQKREPHKTHTERTIVFLFVLHPRTILLLP